MAGLYLDQHTADARYARRGAVGGGGGGAGYTRQTAALATSSLAPGATDVGTIAFAPGFRLYRFTSDQPCRARLYTTAAKRDADLSRPVGTDPTGDHGLLLEFVATPGLLTADLSPMVDGFDGKATPDGVVHSAVTNTGPGSAAITAQLTWIRTE